MQTILYYKKDSLKYLSKIEKYAIKQFVKLIKTALGENLIDIEIFGSKVRGDFTQESDIDMLIVVKNRTLDVMDKVGDIASELIFKYNLPLSPVVFSEYEYKINTDMSSPFTLNVKAEGVKL